MADASQVTADLQRQREAGDLAAQYPSSGRPGGDLLRSSADAAVTTDLTVGPTVYGTSADAIPTDPAEFQQWLNDHGANLIVDGIIGPLTVAAANALGVPVPGAVPTAGAPVQSGTVTGGSDAVAIITRVANELGVDPKLALAIAQAESGLDPNAPGDFKNGQPTSFGLFQLHQGGELGNMTPESVMGDAAGMDRNARTALTEVANVQRAHPDWTPGQIAAAAQRPADQAGYAQKINALYQGGPITDGGTAAGAGAGASPRPADLTPEQVAQEMRARYGYLGGLLDRPDIAKVLTDGITQDKADNEILADLYGTDTWRTTQSSVRNWIGLTSQDPASAQAQIGQRQADITQQATRIGITISADRLRQIAEDSLKFGWDNTQLQQAIAAEFHYKPGAQTGQLGAAEGDLRSIARQYEVPIDDNTLASYEQQIAAGTATADTFKQDFVKKAQGLFPGIAASITVDNPTSNAVASWRTMAVHELGIDPGTVDFTQPKWSRAVNQIDPKTGTPMPMSLYDWQKTLRGDETYGWQYTKNGQDAGFQFQHNLLTALGKAPA